MRQEYQDEIDRYLLDKMSDKERKSFEEKCTKNSELKEQLDHTSEVKTAISERNLMLEKIHNWDDEYDEERKAVARKKHLAICWASGIAATFVVGYFLFPATANLGNEKLEGGVTINQKLDEIPQKKSTKERTTVTENYGQLLTKVEQKEKNEENGINLSEDRDVMSFGTDNINPSVPRTGSDYENELSAIEEETNAITQKIVELNRMLNSKEISQEAYNSRLFMLTLQDDEIKWHKAMLLLKNSRRQEALAILNEMRKKEGAYKNKADSLYKEAISR